MNIRYEMLRIMSERTFKALIILGILLMSGLVSANGGTDLPGTIKKFVCKVLNIVWIIATVVALLMIVIYGIKWVTSADDPSARAAAKNGIIHVFIGFFVIVIATVIVGWLIANFAGGETPVNLVNCMFSGTP